MAPVSELACVYSALILHDDDVPVTAEKILKITKAANVNVEPFWPTLFAKALEGHSIGDLICNIGSAPAAGGAVAASSGAVGGEATEEKKEEKKEESEEESDDDMGFGFIVKKRIRSLRLPLSRVDPGGVLLEYLVSYGLHGTG
eukprot:gene12186-13444_t